MTDIAVEGAATTRRRPALARRPVIVALIALAIVAAGLFWLLAPRTANRPTTPSSRPTACRSRRASAG